MLAIVIFLSEAAIWGKIRLGEKKKRKKKNREKY
jgi:hypothetical protein